MRHRPHRGAGRPFRNANWAGAALMLACLILASTGCAPAVMEGRAASMLYDPDRVGGLHATHGLSGVRPGAPGPQGDVEGTDGGDDDRLALLAVNDIQDFWTAIYPQFFAGDYTPVSAIRSYDSTNPLSGRVCGRTVIYGDPNASYCRRDDSISWDRGSLIPNARKYFGDAAVAGVLAHELGHVSNRDILISSIAATLAGAITYLSRFAMFFGGGDRDERRGGGLEALAMMILAPLAALLIQMAVSRSREYQADESGAHLTGNPYALASALAKLDAYSKRIPMAADPSTSHLFIVQPLLGFNVGNLFSTHPPIAKRIERLTGRPAEFSRVA